MRLRSFILAALGAMALAGSTLPVFANNWRRDRHEWREHEWRQHHGWRPGYYAPPPVYYGYSPGLNFGVTIR